MSRPPQSALQFLLARLEKSTGGRKETITADFGNKPMKTIPTDTFSEPLPQLDTPHIQHSQINTRKVDADEALDYFYLIRCPAVLSEGVMLTQLRPLAHKPYLIRLLEPRLVGHTSSRRRYSSIRKDRVGE
jgi:hypothetical protein